MRHLWRLTGAAALALLVFALPAAAVPDQGKRANDDTAASKSTQHDFRHAIAKKQDALLQQALVAKLNGKATGKVHEVAKGQYVELEREGTDKIFAIIVEFGDERYPHPLFGDTDAEGEPASDAQRFDGPMHNEIPEPDRSVDNSTLWQADYSTAHYEDMYFNRMKEYYERQSSNRYSIEGKVHGWVKVPYNQALYGRDFCGGIVCSTSKMLARDALAVWVQQELDSGKTIEQVADYLRTFDEWDRYDLDGDGNFDEPDGYIDHLQIVHAGGDQAAGDPIYGSDAIWSHRWFSNLQGGGPHGFVGVNVGTNTGLLTSTLVPNNPTGVWIFDYTVQPENGGLGVFAHEYAHDLGLPDLYDTSGNTGGAENSTAFWTLMSSGANIGDGGPDGIGDAPTDLGVWELFQLGWLDAQGGSGPFYEVAQAGVKSEHKLGPNDAATKQAQALFVLLPDSERESVVTPPKTGTWAYWSGQGHNFVHTMTKEVTYAAGATLTADAWWDTEAHFDYWFLEVSLDGGTTWLPVTTNESLPESDDEGSFNESGTGIAGSSGGVYKPLTASLPGSGTALVRFKYMTDANTGGKGVVLDNIAIGGGAADGGESESDRNAWTYDGFLAIENGVGITKHFNAYVAENRQYDGYDTSLATAYNFGFLDSKPDWVESYPYQNGLLISYWNEAYGDNNVGDHPGKGLILPVDAHPSFHHTYDGHLMRPRLLSYDSTFGFEATDAITVHKDSKPSTIPSQPAVPVFDDRNDYWFNADADAATGSHVGRYQPGWNSVAVPKTGTQIRVKSVSGQGKLMQVEVRPAK
jgi:immune inhibitor A